MFELLAGTKSKLENCYPNDKSFYGEYPPYKELGEYGIADIGSVLTIMEWGMRDYLEANEHLRKLVESFTLEQDPTILSEAFTLMVFGNVMPEIVGKPESISNMVDNYFSDFSLLLLGYIVHQSALSMNIEHDKLISESRKKYVQLKALVFDSLACNLKEIVVDRKRPKDLRSFAISIFGALSKLSYLNAAIYKKAREGQTVTANTLISSGEFTAEQIGSRFLIIQQILMGVAKEDVLKASTGKKDMTTADDAVTAPASL